MLETPWSAYQAALWNGIQTFCLSEVAASSRAAMEKHLNGPFLQAGINF
jgi:hypothetical protein